MTTVLVTGGMGFVGLYTARELARRGDRAIIFDIACPASTIEQRGAGWGGVRDDDPDGPRWMSPAARRIVGKQNDNLVFLHGDTLNVSELIGVMRQYSIEKIVHAASFFDPLLEFERPFEAFKVNVEGAVTVFEAARILGTGRVVYLSSIAANAVRQYEPIDEAHPTFSITTGNPSGPHGSVKTAAEALGMTYFSAYGLDFVGLRLAAAYGYGMKLPLHVRPIVEHAVRGTACVFEQGEMRRDYVYIADVVDGVLKALDADPARLRQRIFNIGSGVITSTQELADAVRSIVPSAQTVVGGGLSELEASNFRMRGRLDVTAAREQLGYAPAYDLKAGLTAYIDELRAAGAAR